MNTSVQYQALLTHPRPAMSQEVLSDPPDQMTAGWHEPSAVRQRTHERAGPLSRVGPSSVPAAGAFAGGVSGRLAGRRARGFRRLPAPEAARDDLDRDPAVQPTVLDEDPSALAPRHAGADHERVLADENAEGCAPA